MSRGGGGDGWASGFRLLDSPETRLLDLRAKKLAAFEMLGVIVYCCHLLTVFVVRFGWPGVLYGIGCVALTGFVGPPKWHPVCGSVRVAVAVLLGDPLLSVVASVLWAAELADGLVMCQMHAAGHGGAPAPWRVVREERVAALRRIKAEAQGSSSSGGSHA